MSSAGGVFFIRSPDIELLAVPGGKGDLWTRDETLLLFKLLNMEIFCCRIAVWCGVSLLLLPYSSNLLVVVVSNYLFEFMVGFGSTTRTELLYYISFFIY